MLKTLRLKDRLLKLDGPKIMAVLNATPDSFSDPGEYMGVEAGLERARHLLAEGADLIDVGGESAVTNRPAVSVEEEIERVCPLIERLVSELGATVSVDTHKVEVARRAIEAGAMMVNDTSGLRDSKMAELCAQTGAALVVMHTLARPKQKIEQPEYDDSLRDVLSFLEEKLQLALSCGVGNDRLVVDPGPDFAKTPAQTVDILRGLSQLHVLGKPLLLAVSRKDFVGALTQRPPRDRLAGTLAAVAWGVRCGTQILRVHDVKETRDFLRVWRTLDGESEVAPDLRLADELRWESPVEQRVI